MCLRALSCMSKGSELCAVVAYWDPYLLETWFNLWLYVSGVTVSAFLNTYRDEYQRNSRKCRDRTSDRTSSLLPASRSHWASTKPAFSRGCWKNPHPFVCYNLIYEKRQTSRDLWRKIGYCWRFDSLCCHYQSNTSTTSSPLCIYKDLMYHWPHPPAHHEIWNGFRKVTKMYYLRYQSNHR